MIGDRRPVVVARSDQLEVGDEVYEGETPFDNALGHESYWAAVVEVGDGWFRLAGHSRIWAERMTLLVCPK